MKRARDEESDTYTKKCQKICKKDGKSGNASIRNGKTLHVAAWRGFVDVLNVLIQNGAKMNAVEEINGNALQYAASNGHADVAKVLIRNGVKSVDNKYNETPLHHAAWNGHVDVAKVLIHNGAVVNDVDKDIWTPLILSHIHIRR